MTSRRMSMARGLAEVRSVEMREVLRKLASYARSDVPLMLLGETGTGKSMLARLVHEASGRNGRFVELDCASADPTMLRRDLHGHDKGAFTGAVADGEGLLEAANGGTLFLEELGELPLGEQGRLLRAVETGLTRRVGDTRDRPVNVRVVSATNVDPKVALARGRLREDLWYRLSKLTVTLPPLRQRTEDIPGLVAHWCTTRDPVAVVDQGAIEVLLARRWPGNVRELLGVLDAAWIEREGRPLRAEDVRPDEPPVGADGDATARRMLRAWKRAGSERRAAAALGWSWGRWRREKHKVGPAFR